MHVYNILSIGRAIVFVTHCFDKLIFEFGLTNCRPIHLYSPCFLSPSKKWCPRGFQVPNVFPNMFSIAPHSYPICFAQSPSLSPLYTWVKRMALHPPIKTSILEASKVSGFCCCDGPIKITHCTHPRTKKKKKMNYLTPHA